MATVVDDLITKYTLDPTGYVSGTAAVHRANQSLIGSTSGLTDTFNKLGSNLVGAFTSVLQVATPVVAVLSAAAGAMIAFGEAASKAAAENEAMVKALESVVGGADKAQAVLKLLREAAKAPGLGYQESVQGFSGLVNAGLSGRDAYGAIKEFANANARAGGGKEQFGHIVRALAQMANKPFLQGDELLQLNEANLPAQRMIRDKFGTSDTEELKRRGITSQQVIEGLIESLSKLPRVAGGAKNAFDNAGDAFNFMQVQIGNVINSQIIPFVNDLVEVTEKFNDSGIFKDFAQDMLSLLNLPQSDGGALKGFMLDLLETTLRISTEFSNVIANSKVLLENVMEFIQFLMGPFGFAMKPQDLLGPIASGIGTGNDPERFAHEARMRWEREWTQNENRKEKGDPFGVLDAIKAAAAGVDPSKSTGERIAEYTRQTAEHTKALRDTIREGVIGGAIIGQKGLSQREMARLTSRILDARGV